MSEVIEICGLLAAMSLALLGVLYEAIIPRIEANRDAVLQLLLVAINDFRRLLRKKKKTEEEIETKWKEVTGRVTLASLERDAHATCYILFIGMCCFVATASLCMIETVLELENQLFQSSISFFICSFGTGGIGLFSIGVYHFWMILRRSIKVRTQTRSWVQK